MPARSARKKNGITRREFLSQTAAVAGCLAASAAQRLLGQAVDAGAQGPEASAHASLLSSRSSPDPRVVHVFDPLATHWDYATGWYGDYVSQSEVNKMVDAGVMALTDTSSPADAWHAIIPGYAPGERVAIKVNLVNAILIDGDNGIDALIEPVNRVIGGLKEMGVAESDIWAFDASRAMPNRFRSGCDYPGVQFSGRGVDSNDQGFSDTERVIFSPPGGSPVLPDQRLSQVLVDARYLINMPIMKKHSHCYVTLSFKNHFGTIEQCSKVHEPTFPSYAVYSPDYSPLLDVYQHPQVVGKTVLTIGDGLLGNRVDQSCPPDPWITFGNRAPNSLFFSQDPVAIDCVMYDFLEAEAGVPPAAGDYLMLAAQAGLGTLEHRAPGMANPADWYSLIDYVYLDLSPELAHRVFVPSVRR